MSVSADQVIRSLGLRIGQLEVELAIAQAQIPAPEGELDAAYNEADALAREVADEALRGAEEDASV